MYAHIADDNTTVDRTSDQPPLSMRLKDGRSVSGRSTDPVRLKMGGWVEATENRPTFDPDLEQLVGPSWTVTTEQYVNDDGLDDEGNPVADGQTYTVPATATADYTVEPRPAYLHTDDPVIVADGIDSTVVAYRNGAPDAPASVDFDVNGAVTTVAVDSGIAEVEVSATVHGLIDVRCEGLSLTITATEA